MYQMFLYRIFDVLIKFAYQKSLQIYLYVLISALSPGAHGTSWVYNLQKIFEIRNSEFRIRNSEFGIQNSEFGIRNSEFRIRNSEFGIQNSEFGIVNSNGNRFSGPLGLNVIHQGHKIAYWMNIVMNMPCHTPWPCALTPSWSCVSCHVPNVPLSHL